MMPPVAILAGGHAMRLRPLTDEVPKSLIDVAGQPFIFHQLRTLRNNHITRAVICVGHQGRLIQDAAGDGSGFGIRLDYSYDGPVPLGTGGALKKALPLLPEEFFVLYGDSYLECDYKEVYQAFKDSKKPAMMTVHLNDGRWDRSNVDYRDGMVLAYDKRTPLPGMKYIDYGLSILHKKVFRGFETEDVFDLEALYMALVKEGDMAGYDEKKRFYEIGSFEGLAELREYLSAGAGAVSGRDR